MEKNKMAAIWKGLIVGATMIVPGVSGGTMAMILGIYDRLIAAVSSFRKNLGENFLFLLLFAGSAGVGLFLFSAPLSWLLEHYELPTLYFFIGAVVGGIPLIEKKSGIQKISLSVVLYLLLGAAAVILLSKIPSGILQSQSSDDIAGVTLICVGVISAAALILPGISFSHFLLILGLYDRLLNAVKTINLGFLLPLAFGVLLGIVFLSKLLESLMSRHPKPTYLIILGFMIGSVAEIFPGIPLNGTIFVCAASAISGFFLTCRSC